MKRRFSLFAALLALAAGPARAHRLDEYLQATLFSIRPGEIAASVRLVPGAAVFQSVVARIDTNGDGVLSAEEQERYAEQVVADLSLSVDDSRLALRLVSAEFPSLEAMRQGNGEISIAFAAVLSPGPANRVLSFENAHRRDISVYLVNTLVPENPAVTLGSQTRNESQSRYWLQFSLLQPRL